MNFYRTVLVSICSIISVAVGCGENSASSPADGGSPDGGGCLDTEPAVGSACTSGQCVRQSGDICCIGYTWTCDSNSHTWQKSFVGCACRDAGALPDGGAGARACGDKTCAAHEYCVETHAGVERDDAGGSYSCHALPASCTTNPTCSCISASGGCRCDERAGFPYVTCDYP